ncbi:MAG: RNA pyrophosphohydrolase [Maricaulis sp.]|jgi:putative (di)nucleoside polyphosphate hydrolase|nr:RNA pyrophosphohydrolase [Maricaulis sp.]MDG2043617.1 RNA pyrophosphohydrolase [Maricaulis sp.]
MSDAYPKHRANVGIALFNQTGHVWLGRRDAAPPPYNWQLPQGGIDAGEDPAQAALRELTEETGVAASLAKPLGDIPGWLAYDYPPEVRDDPKFHGKRHLGQKQRWFAYRFEGTDADIALDRHDDIEFDAWRWAELSEITSLIIPWKRAIYQRVATEFRVYASS